MYAGDPWSILFSLSLSCFAIPFHPLHQPLLSLSLSLSPLVSLLFLSTKHPIDLSFVPTLPHTPTLNLHFHKPNTPAAMADSNLSPCKVSYNGAFRRFLIARPAAWSDFEDKVR